MIATANGLASIARSFEASGSMAIYYVAILDADRQPVRRLSGIFRHLEDAAGALAWTNHRYPQARIVREMLYREVATI